MKNIITLIIILTSSVGISQTNLNFQDPCRSCGLSNATFVPPSSMMYKSSDGTQQVGYLMKTTTTVNYYTSTNSKTKSSYSKTKSSYRNFYLKCTFTTPNKPMSTKMSVRLNDNTTFNLSQVKVEFNENSGMYVVSGKKRITSKSMQRKFKLYHITHIGINNDFSELDGQVASSVNILFNCIFFR